MLWFLKIEFIFFLKKLKKKARPLTFCKSNGIKYGGGSSAFYSCSVLDLNSCRSGEMCSVRLSQPLTFPQVLLFGFAAHAVDPRHGLHVALVNGRRVQNGLWCPSQADRQTCSAHQDTCHTWCMCTAQRRTNRHTRVDKAPTVSIFTDLLAFLDWPPSGVLRLCFMIMSEFGRFQSHLPALGVTVQIRSGSLPVGQEPCKRRGKLIDDLMVFILQHCYIPASLA